MLSTVIRDGDDFVIPLDETLFEQSGLNPEEPVEVTIVDGAIVISAVRQPGTGGNP